MEAKQLSARLQGIPKKQWRCNSEKKKCHTAKGQIMTDGNCYILCTAIITRCKN
jgi:hypothetical protein